MSKMISSKHLILFIGTILVMTVVLAKPAAAQRRDYMTDAEIELVRDAQDIDERINVLIKMVDRRFAVLNANVGGATISNKESDKWGPAPTGSRMEILDDIRKLLDKAIDDVDNVAMHPVNYDIDKARSEKQKKKDSNRFPSSVRNLAASAKRYQPALKTLLESSTDEKERGVIISSLESCDEIIAATTKLPAEVKDN
jgi:hypothetical protein